MINIYNYANNIKMVKGVHQLTLRPNTLISLIDHFTIFNGWKDGWTDPCADPGFLSVEGGPGPTASLLDPHMGPIHTYVRTRTHARTHTHVQTTDRHMNVHAQADGSTYMYMYRRQTKIHTD